MVFKTNDNSANCSSCDTIMWCISRWKISKLLLEVKKNRFIIEKKNRFFFKMKSPNLLNCRPCPENSLNPHDFYPNCRYNITYTRSLSCPEGFTGTPPYCYKPCPQYRKQKLKIIKAIANKRNFF